MMECWNNGVFQYRRTGVLARTCAGEDACTPACRTVFPQHSSEVISKHQALGEQASCLFSQCTGRMPVPPVYVTGKPAARGGGSSSQQ